MEHDDDIEMLFRRMENHFTEKGDHATRVFSMLVEIALSYRDELVADNEPALTVGETQEALDHFMEVVKTQSFPNIAQPRIKKLVMLWLKELPKHVHH